ncbi:hypothetical protein AGMMS49942_11840 [Spirochaetia bacterium]|nr:hypothetical protein AGMMS49942_11840 [Spirochaetia bacterium]
MAQLRHIGLYSEYRHTKKNLYGNLDVYLRACYIVICDHLRGRVFDRNVEPGSKFP